MSVRLPYQNYESINMHRPYLIITLIARNEEKHIRTALQSLLNQTYANFKLIVVNNGSTDSTGDIADGFSKNDDRIHVKHLEKNDRLVFNSILNEIDSKYYMFAAGHDYYAPTFIEKCLAALEEDSNAVLAYSRAHWFKCEEDIGVIPGTFDTCCMNGFSRAMLVSYGIVEAHQFYGIYRLEAFKSLARKHVVGDDHVMLTELALLGTFKLINEPLFFLRRADDWGSIDVYRKKHHPNEPDGVWAFLKQTEAFMSIADHLDIPEERNMFKLSLFTMCCQRYGGTLAMFGESLGSLFFRPNFARVMQKITELVEEIEHNIRMEIEGNCTISPNGVLAGNLQQHKRVKIAGEGAFDQDLPKIQSGSDFEEKLFELVAECNPTSVIETGTYLGTGTTRIIAQALKHSGNNNAHFFTIECNPEHHKQALNNLAEERLMHLVSPLVGLSVPRSLLPNLAQIEDEMVQHIEGEDIYVDHQENNRATLYFGETDYPDSPDDLLGKCLKITDFKPSIIVLDSGGHMGNIEFNYVIEQLKGDCFIVLDDIKHVKHYRSYKQILSDARFTILHQSDEKFGFCIAKFDFPG